jgi:hypothetical protein
VKPQSKVSPLPDNLRDRILSQPLYRQRDVKRFLGNPSDSALEQGRQGRGLFAGLSFTKIGRAVFYPAGEVVRFLEDLPLCRSTDQGTGTA